MRPGFRNCYQQGLNMEPDLHGQITLALKISPRGDVVSVSSKVSPSLAIIERCLIEVAEKGQFSPPIGGSGVVTIPISFIKR